MVRLKVSLLVVLLPLLAIAQKTQSVGLVLSGGGAKGIAHIGVIKALEEHNIPIDYVAGTSMGAIVGGLYAAGYTPEEMMQLIQSKGFAYWSSGRIDEKLTYYFSQPDATPALVHFNIGDRDSSEITSILPTSLIDPLPMNFAFMDLFAPYTAQCGGDFNKLFVPLRTVTSNVYAKHKVVCRGGSLGDAIRTSMSFPLVFRPIEMDGVLMYDGGIYDNFPVDVMREDFAPDIMLGVDVSAPDGKPKSNDLIEQLEDMIIQNNDYDLPDDEGIRIKVNVENFSLLDWGKAQAIYQAGYDKAMEMMDSICGRVESRISPESRNLRREVFKSQTPYLRFDSVSVEGGTRSQNAYIEYLFTHNNPDTFGIDRAKDSYYRAIAPGKLENLLPQAEYNENTGLFKLNLKADMKDNYRIGFGGYISSSTSSMLFLSGGYNTMSFNSLDMNANAWIGQSYLAGVLNAKINLLSGVPSALRFQGVISRQKFYETDNLFFEDNQPSFIAGTEMFARLLYSMASGRRGKAEAGVGYGHLLNKFFHNNRVNFAESDRDRAIQNLGQVYANYKYNTLDNQYNPCGGASYAVTAMGVYGRYAYSPFDATLSEAEHKNVYWTQLEVVAKNYFGVSKHFAVGTEFSALASTRKLLKTYNASIVEAPAFNPTPASYNSFNPALRANSFVTGGVVPVFKITETLQLRGSFHGFMPFRKIMEGDGYVAKYGKWFANPQFFGEMAAVVSLPFASLSLYGNYTSYPANNWNFGISFGVFMLAPKFLR